MTILDSIKAIEHKYNTGEEPVTLLCSDMNTYICKYMRSSLPAYKLVCEFVGAKLSKIWGLNVPDTVLVQIAEKHWSNYNIQHVQNAPALGSRQLNSVFDINQSTLKEVVATIYSAKQFLDIALFDFWSANEDRNANNFNLMYDMSSNNIVPIDNGCILNTATFDFPLSQLTFTDTILYSDLLKSLVGPISPKLLKQTLLNIKDEYYSKINNCHQRVFRLIDEIPREWNISSNIVKTKLKQLFDNDWIDGVWLNFKENLVENLRNIDYEI